MDVLENIVGVILEGDVDNDMEIDDDKIDTILHRLNQYEIVDIDNERLKRVIHESGRSIASIMKVVRRLVSDDISEEESIIKIKGL